jgi:hypothetical protein
MMMMFFVFILYLFFKDFGVVDYLRVRVMPVLGTSPSIFGQALASFVLCKLAGSSFSPRFECKYIVFDCIALHSVLNDRAAFPLTIYRAAIHSRDL